MKQHLLQDPKLTTAPAFFARFENAELLKYSPEKRGLMRVEIGTDEFFVKLYPKKFRRAARGYRIHRAGLELWKASAQKLVSFRVPPPVFWDDETRSLWQRRLVGEPAINVFDTEIVRHIGRAVGEIAQLSIDAPRIFSRDEQIADTRDFALTAAAKFPSLASELSEVCERLASFHRATGTERLVPAHGDMHIDQWLFDGESLGLLDFEDFSRAEAERDAAFFCVQIAAEYGNKLDADALESEFLQGLRDAGVAPDERLFKLYKSHKWLAKASKTTNELEARAAMVHAATLLEDAR